MADRYGPDAVEKARKLYVKYGGGNFAAIEKEMRKDYPNWSLQNLSDRGKGKDARLGWITKFGFDKSLEIDANNRIASVENDDERRYKAVVTLADRYQELALEGGEAGEKAVDKFIKLTQQQIELRNKLDLSSANFETFVEDFEMIVKWATDIDKELAKLFFRRKDEFIEKARNHFGESNDN